MGAKGTELAGVLTEKSLQRLAGGQYYQRGVSYFESGRVGELTEYRGKLTAKVQGTRLYRVRLSVQNGSLDYDCSCPLGRDGEFCKHCVAAGLAWLAEQGGKGAAKSAAKGKKGPAVTLEDVRQWLLGQKPEALADMLMEQALASDRLRRSLLLKAAKEKSAASKGGKGLDLEAWREAIDYAVEALAEYAENDDYDGDRYPDYNDDAADASSYEEVKKLNRDLEELLKEGHAAGVKGLAEYGLEALARALSDDREGLEGYFDEALGQFRQLHVKACAQLKPEPQALARWLLGRILESSYGAPYYADYQRVLGKAGQAAFKKLAQDAWAALPPLPPGTSEYSLYGSMRYRLTSLMESLARDSGDLDALVAIKSKTLAARHDYMEIATLYREAKRYDEALDWAERGVAAFPKQAPDWQVREFLADEYHRRKRHEEAMKLVWDEFSGHPFLTGYQALKLHALKAGAWPAWRERALAFIREKIEKSQSAGRAKNQPGWAWARPEDHSVLVEIFLWEGDVEAAWNEAAEGGCRDSLWMDLAKKREQEHPKDSLRVYQEQIETVLAQKNNDAYKEAVRLLKKIKELMERLQRGADFAGYLQRVRAEHKPKRNFMALLDRAKW